ncbi:MAG: hypothetical protein COV90_01710 [Candidatus Tagabacteria bacterium CG11_big_fil_rev_8_21_14_0_20_41_11]|nr:MAG: hypothetical protein COV90_01710 [Candidatus Tagabacteria bacterium CG11_big_fil_rev_8_21_14_0_20_41_11]
MNISFRHFLTTIIHYSLTLAIASSFFIIPGIHVGNIPIPQPFYFFSFLALTGIAIKLFRSPSHFYSKQVFFWLKILALLIIFFSINVLFYFAATGSFTVPYGKDLARVLILVLLFVAILINTTFDRSSLPWLVGALFIPLTLAPVILLRNIDTARTILPLDFFSGYALQAMQYNPSSLGAWLIIPFGLLAPMLLDPSFRRSLRIVSAIVTTTLMALIWWTNSRGTILAAIFILITTAVIYRKKDISLSIIFRGIGIVAIIIIGGFLVLPSQAKTSVFVRFYPQYFQTALQKDFFVPIQQITPKIFISPPNITKAQDRQTLWPEYMRFVATHPLGEFGPALPFEKKGFVYEGAEHNTILQTGAWGGWGALIVFVYFLYEIFKTSALNIIKQPENARHVAVGLLMAFIGVLVIALLNSFLQVKTLWFLMAILAAYSLRDTSEAKSPS